MDLWNPKNYCIHVLLQRCKIWHVWVEKNHDKKNKIFKEFEDFSLVTYNVSLNVRAALREGAVECILLPKSLYESPVWKESSFLKWFQDTFKIMWCPLNTLDLLNYPLWSDFQFSHILRHFHTNNFIVFTSVIFSFFLFAVLCPSLPNFRIWSYVVSCLNKTQETRHAL